MQEALLHLLLDRPDLRIQVGIHHLTMVSMITNSLEGKLYHAWLKCYTNLNNN